MDGTRYRVPGIPGNCLGVIFHYWVLRGPIGVLFVITSHCRVLSAALPGGKKTIQGIPRNVSRILQNQVTPDITVMGDIQEGTYRLPRMVWVAQRLNTKDERVLHHFQGACTWRCFSASPVHSLFKFFFLKTWLYIMDVQST